MKKFIIILCCLFTTFASAEEIKIALLQPRVSQGSDQCKPIELNMIRGELRKALGWQSKYQVLTRSDVDAMLKEHGFQRSGLVDDEQRKRVGIMTGAQYICVSTVTKDGTQLYIESYLVDVETGQMTNPATQYANVTDEDYSTLQGPCNALAKEMLGDIKSHPDLSKTIEQDFPTENIITYVDLGLPSGTLWKNANENEGLMTFEQALLFYGRNLPTKKQWEELINSCVWTWTGKGYKVIGPSRESLFLPAEGYSLCSGSEYYKGSYGYYWTSTPLGSETAWRLYFNSGGKEFGNNIRCFGLSIRLVR